MLVYCNTTARFLTVQLAIPGSYLPANNATCGVLKLCSVQAYGAFVPPAAPSSALTVAFIESFAIPVGVFVLLAIPFAFYLLFRHAERRRQALLEHWPVITPKRLVADGEVPAETPPTRGKSLMAEADRGGRSPRPAEDSDWALNAHMGNLDESAAGGGDGYGSALAKAFAPQPPSSPGAEFRNPMFGAAVAAPGAPQTPMPSAPPAQQEAWY
jgi:hypothetical protein